MIAFHIPPRAGSSCAGLALAASLLCGSTPILAQEMAVNDATDIVVTALKRSTNLQETPLAISAVGGETLANMGVQDSTQLARTVPSLVFRENANGGSRVVIRNIQSSGEPTVGLYYDETPIIGSAGVSNDAGGSTPEVRLFDVERVEVLRGPQGTLYGSGSMAGTLRLIFNKPNLTDFQGAAAAQGTTVSHGGEGYEVQGMVNVPIVYDMLALRVVGFYRDRDGWIDNDRLNLKDINGLTSKGGRAMLRFQPTHNLTFDALAVIQRTDGSNSNWYFPNYQSPNSYVPKPDGKPYLASFESLQPQKDNLDLYSGTLSWDFGFASATAVVSYSKRRLEFNFDTSPYFRNAAANATVNSTGCKNYNATGGLPCTPAQLLAYKGYALAQAPSTAFQPQETKSWTEEFRVSGNGDSRLNWTLGFFHSSRDGKIRSDIATVDPDTGVMEPLTPDNLYFRRAIDDKLTQIAGFGEASYELTDRLNLTFGARWFEYEKTVGSEVTVGNFVVGNAVQPYSSAKAKENGWVLKFGADYKLADDMLAYFTAGQGFRPGGVNQVIGLPDALGPYTSDSLWSYEFGLKTSWMDRRIILNADIFQIDWSDMQASAQTVSAQANGSTFSFITNAGDVRIRGVELEMTVRPIDGLTLQASGSYIDARLREDQTAPPGISINGAGRKGDRVPQTPPLSVQGSAEYRFAIGHDLQILTRGDVAYIDDSWMLFRRTNAYQQRLPGYTTVGARLGLERGDGLWSVGVFANNILNSMGLVSKANGALFGGGNNVRVLTTTPRTIGIDLRTRF